MRVLNIIEDKNEDAGKDKRAGEDEDPIRTRMRARTRVLLEESCGE